jgi:hypothetical protein
MKTCLPLLITATLTGCAITPEAAHSGKGSVPAIPPGVHARYINEGEFLFLEGYGDRLAIKVTPENQPLCDAVFDKINR